MSKYGYCTNPDCNSKDKRIDVVDSNFVCGECEGQLTESLVDQSKFSNKTKSLFMALVVLGLTLLGGLVYLWTVKPLTASVSVDTQKNIESPKMESNNIGKKSLEEWLNEYSVDR